MGGRRRDQAGALRPAFIFALTVESVLLLMCCSHPSRMRAAPSLPIARTGRGVRWRQPHLFTTSLSDVVLPPTLKPASLLVVNTTTDEDIPGDRLCGLREAIINSNFKAGAGSDCGPAVGNVVAEEVCPLYPIAKRTDQQIVADAPRRFCGMATTFPRLGGSTGRGSGQSFLKDKCVRVRW